MSTPRRSRKDHEPRKSIPGTPAIVPSATTDTPNAIERAAIDPTQEDIARRAYQLYEERGGEHGRAWEDWFQAEWELRQLTLHHVIKSIRSTGRGHAAA